MARIALVEDELALREEMAEYLRSADHSVVELGTCAELRASVYTSPPDVLIADRFLPDGDALDTAITLAHLNPHMGLVIFTALENSADRVEGLRYGVDHYLTKPIQLPELLAVTESLMRRLSLATAWKLDHINWTILTPEGLPINLTPQEYQFIDALNSAPNLTLTRTQIMKALGKSILNYEARSLDALVLRMRKKAATISRQPLPVKTVHGTGYALTTQLQPANQKGTN